MKMNKVDKPMITKGFIIFSIVVLLLMSTLLALIPLPYGLDFVLAIFLGWNIRGFYFGPWQRIQTATLISLNSWLKK